MVIKPFAFETIKDAKPKFKNMRKTIWTATLIITFSLSVNAFAQTVTPKVAQKQANQQARIQEGKASGELTRREKRQLQLQQAAIQKDKQVAKSNGVVTCQERRHLNREQRRASKNIYRQKHDKQAR